MRSFIVVLLTILASSFCYAKSGQEATDNIPEVCELLLKMSPPLLTSKEARERTFSMVNREIKSDNDVLEISYSFPKEGASLAEKTRYWQWKFGKNPEVELPSYFVKARIEDLKKDPWEFWQVSAFMPKSPETSNLVHSLLDRIGTERENDVELRQRIRKWLMLHGNYFRQDLVTASRGVLLAMELERRANREDRISLRRKETTELTGCERICNTRFFDREHYSEVYEECWKALLHLVELDPSKAKNILIQLLTKGDTDKKIEAAAQLYVIALSQKRTDSAKKWQDYLTKVALDESLGTSRFPAIYVLLRCAPSFALQQELARKLCQQKSLLSNKVAEPLIDVEADDRDNFWTPQKTLLSHLFHNVKNPKKWCPFLVSHLNNKNRVVHENAVCGLVAMLDGEARKKAAKALLPWLFDPKWSKHSTRCDLIKYLGANVVPAAKEGLFAALNRPTDAKECYEIAKALTKYDLERLKREFVRANVLFKNARSEVFELSLRLGAFTIDEVVHAVLAFLDPKSQLLDDEVFKRAFLGTNDLGKETLRALGQWFKYRSPIDLGAKENELVDKLVVIREKVGPGVSMGRQLDKLLWKWKGLSAVDYLAKSLLSNPFDFEVVQASIMRHKELIVRKRALLEKVARSSSASRPMAMALLCRATEDWKEKCEGLLAELSDDEKSLFLSCARLLEVPFNYSKVGEFLDSKNELLQKAAAAYLKDAKCGEAYDIIIKRFPESYHLFGALAHSVNEETRLLLSELKAKDGPKRIIRYYTSSGSWGVWHSSIIRLWHDRGTYSLSAGHRQYVYERTLSKRERYEIENTFSREVFHYLPDLCERTISEDSTWITDMGSTYGREVFISGAYQSDLQGTIYGMLMSLDSSLSGGMGFVTINPKGRLLKKLNEGVRSLTKSPKLNISSVYRTDGKTFARVPQEADYEMYGYPDGKWCQLINGERLESRHKDFTKPDEVESTKHTCRLIQDDRHCWFSTWGAKKKVLISFEQKCPAIVTDDERYIVTANGTECDFANLLSVNTRTGEKKPISFRLALAEKGKLQLFSKVPGSCFVIAEYEYSDSVGEEQRICWVIDASKAVARRIDSKIVLDLGYGRRPLQKAGPAKFYFTHGDIDKSGVPQTTVCVFSCQDLTSKKVAIIKGVKVNTEELWVDGKGKQIFLVTGGSLYTLPLPGSSLRKRRGWLMDGNQ